MKTKLITAVIFAITVTSGFSQHIKIEDAKQVALNFYFERINQYEPVNYKNISIGNSYTICSESNTVYYAFCIKPSGYVIVSGTGNVLPVPAYSLKSSYSSENQPPQFTAWMKQYYDQISYSIENSIAPATASEREWKRLLSLKPEELKVLKDEKEVLPMLTSSWDQGLFYNQMCPADPAGPAGHCVTGCVATAMGQICYYFRWPDTGTGSYTYQHPVYGTISANFGETQYKWNEMTNSLNRPNLAVAELLFHLGVSVDMDYGPTSSGMWNHKAAYSLRTYFKYAPETEYLFRDSTNLAWDSVIVAHLDQKIPLYYAGWSEPNVSGHAFVCDGYQTEDYFHFNWGWGGSFDGYFYLDDLSPGGSNFNLAQELVINCCPDTVNYSYPYYCTGADTLFSLYGTIDDGSCAMYDYLNNSDCSWLINPQTIQDSVSYIILEFNRFDTEPVNDILTIYDGESTEDPILGQFSGTTLPETLTSSGNKVLITFSSNENITAPGWFISYTSVQPEWCSGLTVLTEPVDTFSDGSGSFYYLNGSICMWNIQPQWASEITLHFLEFDTEENKDFVKIYDTETNQLLATYSGTYEPDSLPEPVTSPSGKMFFTFSSNPTITRQGWTAFYSINNVGISNKCEDQTWVFIHPNPVKQFITIELRLEETQNVCISISDLKGQNVFNKEIESISGILNKKVDVKNLPQGVYILQVTGKRNNHVVKIIKTY